MNGLALTIGKRRITRAPKYDRYFLGGGSMFSKENASDVHDTVRRMAAIVRTTTNETEKLAAELKGRTREETLQNIHQFMVKYLQYDTERGEKLRSPARSWHVGNKQTSPETGDTGVDCDDMAMFAASLLSNLNIPFYFKIVAVQNPDQWEHVYVVVPQEGENLGGSGYFTLDGVIDKFNYEHPYKKQETLDKHGVVCQNLNGLENGSNPIESLLVNLRAKLIKHPEVFYPLANPEDYLELVNDVLTHKEDKQEFAKAIQSAAVTERTMLGTRFFIYLQKYIQQSKGVGDWWEVLDDGSFLLNEDDSQKPDGGDWSFDDELGEDVYGGDSSGWFSNASSWVGDNWGTISTVGTSLYSIFAPVQSTPNTGGNSQPVNVALNPNYQKENPNAGSNTSLIVGGAAVLLIGGGLAYAIMNKKPAE